MQVKVYEIAWGETVTSTGAVAGDVVTYNITFSDQGVQGPTGPTGATGPSNVLNIGTVTTGAAGSSASATITGVTPSQTLNLTIPRGDTGSTGPEGPAGPANTLSIGTVTTGAAGSNATASITGTAPNQTLNLAIPQGDPGTGVEILTTKGDLLYQDTSAAARLPIGSSGQILKVSVSGVPEWGAAPTSGVSSVSGTAPIISSGGATPAISITAATTSASGSMSAADKLKLDGIAAGAEVNVNADWDAGSGDAQILNKPTIPSGSSSAPSALGVASAGSSANFARADHVHAMPTAADVGAAADDDPRLSDTRDPNAHAASHAAGEADQLFDQSLNTTDNVEFSQVTTTTKLVVEQNGGASVECPDPNAVLVIDSATPPNMWFNLRPAEDASNATLGWTEDGNYHHGIIYTSGDNRLTFTADGASPDPTDGLAIDGSNNVGIGVMAPSAKLDINGNVIIRDAVNEYAATIDAQDALTANRNYTLPDANGTLVVDSQLGSAAISNSYTDLDELPILGTAASEDSTAFAAVSHTHPDATTTVAGFLSAADKTKLDGIASGAEVNVQADWNQSDNASDDFIKNKPTLGSAATASTSDFAAASHTHGNITNDGKIGSTAGLPVITTTAGAVTTLALGTANQILRVNSGASGVEFADPAASGVTGAAASASDVLGVSGANITGVDATADRIVFWDDSASALKHLTVGSGLSLTDTTLTATATGTIGGSTGSTDNSLLRSDGTGGATLQDSAFVIPDNFTASPNNTVNHASIQATGSSTNVSVSIVPKGTGSFSLQVPNSGTGGGNVRGANAVDLQTVRANANQVASALQSVICGGSNNRCTQDAGVVVGGQNNLASGILASILGGAYGTASGNMAVVCGGGFWGGGGNLASGQNSAIVGGDNNEVSAIGSSILCGFNGLADRRSMQAHASGQFAAKGDAQRARFVLRCKTTTNTAVEMALDGGTTYLTIPSGKVLYGEISIVGVKSTGADVALYYIRYAAKNVGGTSSEIFSSVTTDNAAGTSLTITTQDTGDYISIKPVGVSGETWRWVAKADLVEVAYGT